MSQEPANRGAAAPAPRRWPLSCAALVVAMVGAAYAAVPLYRLFCQVTGFDGTPRIATSPSATVLDQTVTMRFDGNVAPGLPWRFEPVQTTMDVKIGENMLAFYRATNTSDQPRTRHRDLQRVARDRGRLLQQAAVLLLHRAAAASRARPWSCRSASSSIPQIVNDKDARAVTHITLSYTFYPVPRAKAGTWPRSATGNAG